MHFFQTGRTGKPVFQYARQTLLDFFRSRIFVFGINEHIRQLHIGIHIDRELRRTVNAESDKRDKRQQYGNGLIDGVFR